MFISFHSAVFLLLIIFSYFSERTWALAGMGKGGHWALATPR